MLNPSNFVKEVYRPYPPLFASLVLYGLANKSNNIPILGSPLGCSAFPYINEFWYWPKKSLTKYPPLLMKSWSDPRRFKKSIIVFKAREKKLIRSTRQSFSSFAKAYEEYMAALWIYLADEAIRKKIYVLLSKKLNSTEVDELMNTLNIPLQNNFCRQETYELINTENIKKHVAKYEWISSRYGAIHPYTQKQARAKRTKILFAPRLGRKKSKLLFLPRSTSQINKTHYLASYKKQKREIHATIQKAKSLLSQNQKHFIDIMQFLIFYRTQRTDVINMCQYLYVPKLKQVGHQLRLTYKELLYCTKDELLNTIPSKKVLHQRMRGFALILENGKVSAYHGEEFKKMKHNFQTELPKTKRLKGQCAYKGKVIGKVRLISTLADFQKKPLYAIIATHMTTTDMVPYLKNVRAIITDEGGIMCHAAIISRECKIPCVMGTKIATEVLKNGDIVEVDAQAGVVEIKSKTKKLT